MKLQRSLHIFLRAMFIGIVFGTFCIHKSFGRPTKLENFSPPGPSDLRIAFADPIVEGRSNAQGPKFEGKKKVPRAARYLLNFGYLESKDFNDENVTENQIESAIKNFQHFAHLPLTGRLDDATVNQMEKPRCGMKDPRIKFKVNGKGRQKRYTLQGEKWDFSTRSTRTLTWYLVNTYGSMTRDDIRRIIHYALGKWQAAANINFKEVQTNSADILVSFAPGQHGDPYPFDGRGGTLAHAYYPYKNFALGGDIHFDADEYFTFQKKEGTNLLWVAVHEAGHSLGLEHSDLLDAVMYPWYRGSEASDFDLRPDDISGIQALYGPRPQPPTTAEPTTQPTTKPTTQPTTKPTTQPTTKPTTQPTTKPTTQPTTKPTTQPTTKPTTQPTTKPTTQPTTKPTTQPTTKPTTQPTTPDTQGPTRPPGMKDCMEYVDAAVIDFSSGWMYLFSGENFYLVSRRGLRYGPITFKTYFREVEGKVTAAYMRQNDFALILFSGSRYYVYQRFSLIKEGPVSDFGLPADATVDAALQWQGSSRTPWTAGTKTYLFTGTKYYRYDEITKRIDSYYPRVVSSAWRGLPSQVTAAVTGFEVEGNRKETYFINGKYYYIFDDEFIKVKPGYPKHIKDWLKCYSTDSAPFGSIGSLFALDDPEDDPQKAP